MKTGKTILKYLLWLIVSTLLSMFCIWIEVETPSPVKSSFLNALKFYIIFIIGGILGVITFLTFLPIDIFYLKHRNFKIKNKNLIRFFCVLILAVLFKILHHILEYDLNWI